MTYEPSTSFLPSFSLDQIVLLLREHPYFVAYIYILVSQRQIFNIKLSCLLILVFENVITVSNRKIIYKMKYIYIVNEFYYLIETR